MKEHCSWGKHTGNRRFTSTRKSPGRKNEEKKRQKREKTGKNWKKGEKQPGKTTKIRQTFLKKNRAIFSFLLDFSSLLEWIAMNKLSTCICSHTVYFLSSNQLSHFVEFKPGFTGGGRGHDVNVWAPPDLELISVGFIQIIKYFPAQKLLRIQ